MGCPLPPAKPQVRPPNLSIQLPSGHFHPNIPRVLWFVMNLSMAWGSVDIQHYEFFRPMSLGDLPICLCFLVSFIRVLTVFSVQIPSLPLLNLFLSILLFLMLLWVDCFLSFSDLLLLVYRNATDLFVGFVSCTVNDSLISSNSFLVGLLGLSVYEIISSACCTWPWLCWGIFLLYPFVEIF